MNMQSAQVLDDIKRKLKTNPDLVQALYNALVDCAEDCEVEPILAAAVAKSFLADTLDCEAKEVY